MIKRNKILILIILLISSFLISGCVSSYFDIYVNSDGSGKIEIIYNYENLFLISNQYEEFHKENISLNNICEEYYETILEETNLSIDCNVQDHKIKVSLILPKNFFEITINEDETYTYELNSNSSLFKAPIPKNINYSYVEEKSKDIDSEILLVEIIYFINFEGDIIETNKGILENNILIVEILEPKDYELDLIVKARTKDSQQKFNEENTQISTIKTQKNISIEIIFLIIIITMIFTLILLKKKNPIKKQEKKIKSIKKTNFENFTENKNLEKNKDQELSYNVKKIIQWIHLYQDKYSDEVLKDTLRKSKVTEQEINIAFQNK